MTPDKRTLHITRVCGEGHFYFELEPRLPLDFISEQLLIVKIDPPIVDVQSDFFNDGPGEILGVFITWKSPKDKDEDLYMSVTTPNNTNSTGLCCSCCFCCCT